MKIKDIVNLYNATVLEFFIKRNSLVSSGALLIDINPLEFKSKGQSADVLVPQELLVQDFDPDDVDKKVVRQSPELESIPVVLDQLKDVTFEVGSEVMDAANRFDLLAKFAERAAKALIKDVDEKIALEHANSSSTLGDGTTGYTEAIFLEARKEFNAVDADEEDRYILTKDDTTMISSGCISSDNNVVVVENGKAVTVRSIPEKAGFKIFRSNAIKQVTGVNKDLAIQKNAMLFVNRPLELKKSNGDIAMSVLEMDGITLRTTFWYDPDRKSDVLSTDLLYTVKTLEPALLKTINISG